MEVPGFKIFGGEAFYTDWAPRGGDGFLLRGQMITADASTGVAVKVDVYTKNRKDSGNPGTALVTDALSLDESSTAIVEHLEEPPDGDGSTGVKEMVRLRFSATGLASGEWMLIRTFPFVWFEGAKGS